MSITIRPTSMADGQAIYELVNTYARQGLMLPRSQSAVYQAIRDFVVADFGELSRAEEEGQILGCGALQITWGDLGEIRSLAVANGWQGRGIGRRIVERLLEEARQLGLPRVFALTYQRPFFLRLGFQPIGKEALPQKIWADCVDCIKFPNCDEEAVIIYLLVTWTSASSVEPSGGHLVERSGAPALQPPDHQTREGMIRKAKVADVEAMAQVINGRAALGELLPRSQHHIYHNLRDFVVCEREGHIVGTGAMHVLWSDLGEIRALAVAGPWQGQGIGTAIVQALAEEARALGLPRVFAFTYKPGFFQRLGFYLVDKETLPRKVWGECIHCVKFPNCDEVALVLDLNNVVLSPQSEVFRVRI